MGVGGAFASLGSYSLPLGTDIVKFGICAFVGGSYAPPPPPGAKILKAILKVIGKHGPSKYAYIDKYTHLIVSTHNTGKLSVDIALVSETELYTYLDDSMEQPLYERGDEEPGEQVPYIHYLILLHLNPHF